MELGLKDIKEIVLMDNYIQITTKDGWVGREYFTNYPKLKQASVIERKNYTTSELGLHWEDLDEDLSFSGFFKTKSNNSEIKQLFSNFEEINLSAFARKMGIAQPLLADYISGKRKPGLRRRKEIEKALHDLGKRLIAINN